VINDRSPSDCSQTFAELSPSTPGEANVGTTSQQLQEAIEGKGGRTQNALKREEVKKCKNSIVGREAAIEKSTKTFTKTLAD
jgi:hypothetical protein